MFFAAAAIINKFASLHASLALRALPVVLVLTDHNKHVYQTPFNSIIKVLFSWLNLFSKWLCVFFSFLVARFRQYFGKNYQISLLASGM
jgi:hypothetical protein